MQFFIVKNANNRGKSPQNHQNHWKNSKKSLLEGFLLKFPFSYFESELLLSLKIGSIPGTSSRKAPILVDPCTGQYKLVHMNLGTLPTATCMHRLYPIKPSTSYKSWQSDCSFLKSTTFFSRLWFHFTVENTCRDQRVIFNVVNLSKWKTLFTEGTVFVFEFFLI